MIPTALQSVRFPVEKVTLSEGVEVYVRSLSAGDAELFAKSCENTEDGLPIAVRLVCLCLCDEKGERVCVDGDEAELAKLPAPAIGAMFEVAARLNGLGVSAEGN